MNIFTDSFGILKDSCILYKNYTQDKKRNYNNMAEHKNTKQMFNENNYHQQPPRTFTSINETEFPYYEPFNAFLYNLPNRTSKKEIRTVFSGLNVLSVFIPNSSERFAKVMFKTRNDLIAAIRNPNLRIRNTILTISLRNRIQANPDIIPEPIRYDGYVQPPINRYISQIPCNPISHNIFQTNPAPLRSSNEIPPRLVRLNF